MRITVLIVCLVASWNLGGIARAMKVGVDEVIPKQKNSPSEDDALTKKARTRMIEQQLVRRNIKDPRVLRAMRDTPRELFVPERLRKRAHDDSPLPIGHGQTISQPYIVAFMTQILNPKSTERVLEIGTGSGYQAAVLAPLVKEVYSIEIIEPLHERAKATLEALKITNVHLRSGDGYQGWPEKSPFDAIIVTCAPEKIPQALIDQLADGGRMIIPVGPAFGSQELVLLNKRDGKMERESVLPVRFVPMTGEPGD